MIAALPLNVLPLSLVGVRTIRLEIWFKPCRYIQRTQELIQRLISSSWNQKLPVPCQLVYSRFAKSQLANWKSTLSLTMSLTNLLWHYCRSRRNQRRDASAIVSRPPGLRNYTTWLGQPSLSLTKMIGRLK